MALTDQVVRLVFIAFISNYLSYLQRLNLDSYMLYAHGSDLCHDLELRHAMANCFEALMGALFLDGGIEVNNYCNKFCLCGMNYSLK